MIRNDLIPPALDGRVSRLRARLDRALTTLPLDISRAAGPRLRRAFDLAIGGAGLLATAPILVAAAVAIKVTSPGPVLFRQIRIGRAARPFDLYKLRTMGLGAEQRRTELDGLNESEGNVTFKIRRDPRITAVGRVLRRFSVDELPQLWNLVNGTMTLFGPRPPVPSEVAKYGQRQRRRLEVSPGLTCLWQVSGRSDLSFEEQVELDIHYIDRSRPRDEVVILARTVPAVLTGRGAY